MVAVDDPQPMQRPQGMNRADVQTDGIHRLIGDEFQQLGNNIGLTALDQQPLSVSSPQQVVSLQCGDQLTRAIH